MRKIVRLIALRQAAACGLSRRYSSAYLPGCAALIRPQPWQRRAWQLRQARSRFLRRAWLHTNMPARSRFLRRAWLQTNMLVRSRVLRRAWLHTNMQRRRSFLRRAWLQNNMQGRSMFLRRAWLQTNMQVRSRFLRKLQPRPAWQFQLPSEAAMQMLEDAPSARDAPSAWVCVPVVSSTEPRPSSASALALN